MNTGEREFEYMLFPELTDNLASSELRYVEDVWFSQNENIFASIIADGIFRVWRTDTGENILDFNVGSIVIHAEVSPDKTQLAYVDEQNELHIIEINDLITAQIRLKIDECVTNDEFHAKLNELLDTQDIAEFIGQLEAADSTSISTECADELIDMANLLIGESTD